MVLSYTLSSNTAALVSLKRRSKSRSSRSTAVENRAFYLYGKVRAPILYRAGNGSRGYSIRGYKPSEPSHLWVGRHLALCRTPMFDVLSVGRISTSISLRRMETSKQWPTEIRANCHSSNRADSFFMNLRLLRLRAPFLRTPSV